MEQRWGRSNTSTLCRMTLETWTHLPLALSLPADLACLSNFIPGPPYPRRATTHGGLRAHLANSIKLKA